MTFTNSLRFAVSLVVLFVSAGIAAAQGPVIDANSTTSELEMSANVQTSVQLNISTNGGAAVTGDEATGLFLIDLGDVNGLGMGTPASGVSVAVDATGATYSTPINLTPVYSGFTTESADVTVEAGGSADQAIAREGGSAVTMSAVTTAVSAFSNAASDSLNTRYVGFRIARTEAAGAKEATLIYTVTVQD